MKPLKQLLTGMKRISKGDYQTRIKSDRDDEFATLADSFNNMAMNLSEKNRLAQMVSESAVEMASSDEAELKAMKGQRRLTAVLYIGIQNYRSLIENTDWTHTRNLLNQWVDHVSEVVSNSGGEVDKVMEGKILAAFFADKDSVETVKNYLTRAYDAAMQLCYCDKHKEITVGAGVHKGTVISGLMGNSNRRDLTIIGDPVNVAARCFSIAAHQGKKAAIISTESTAEEIRDLYDLEAMGSYSIKGKKDKIQLFKIKSR